MNVTKAKALAPLGRDLGSAFLVGVLAGLFASIALTNLELIGKEYFGITLSIPLVFVVFIVLCLAGIVVARIGGRFLPIIYKFGKFGEAGGLNWLVDLGVVNLLMLVTGIVSGPYFALFKAISFIAAATNSYFWNKYWVFSGAKKQKESKEVFKFAAATTAGMVLNVVIATAITTIGPLLISDIESKTWANIATIIGSLTGMMFNFVVYKIWVFKN